MTKRVIPIADVVREIEAKRRANQGRPRANNKVKPVKVPAPQSPSPWRPEGVLNADGALEFPLTDTDVQEVARLAKMPVEKLGGLRADLMILLTNVWSRSYWDVVEAHAEVLIAADLERVRSAAKNLLAVMESLYPFSQNRLARHWLGQTILGPAQSAEELHDMLCHFGQTKNDDLYFRQITRQIATLSTIGKFKGKGRPPKDGIYDVSFGAFDFFLYELTLALVDRGGKPGSNRTPSDSTIKKILRLLIPHVPPGLVPQFLTMRAPDDFGGLHRLDDVFRLAKRDYPHMVRIPRNAFSSGRPIFIAKDRIERRLAWCGINDLVNELPDELF